MEMGGDEGLSLQVGLGGRSGREPLERCSWFAWARKGDREWFAWRTGSCGARWRCSDSCSNIWQEVALLGVSSRKHRSCWEKVVGFWWGSGTAAQMRLFVPGALHVLQGGLCVGSMAGCKPRSIPIPADADLNPSLSLPQRGKEGLPLPAELPRAPLALSCQTPMEDFLCCSFPCSGCMKPGLSRDWWS